MLTETFVRYGQSQPPAELVPLRAGPLTMLYDPSSGMVRRIKQGEVEVLRGIYAAVRDSNWGTVPGAIRELVRTVEPQSFHLEFESEHQQGSIQFIWRGVVRGEADGTVRYEFAGEAKSTFLRNRIGFCVLHPIRECAGARARRPADCRRRSNLFHRCRVDGPRQLSCGNVLSRGRQVGAR